MDFTIKPKLGQDSNDLAKEKSAIVRYINRLPKSASPGREEEGEGRVEVADAALRTIAACARTAHAAPATAPKKGK